MKRLLLMILCMVCMAANAQKMPAKKVTSSSNHITYMGISLGESLSNFKRKLKTLNYTVVEHPDSYEPWTDIKGSYGGVSNFSFNFSCFYEKGMILDFFGEKKYVSKANAESDFDKIKSYLNQRYSKNKTLNYNFKVIGGFYNIVYAKELINNIGKVIGHIYLSYSKKDGDGDDYDKSYYNLEIRYSDNNNNLAFDRDPCLSYKVPYDCIMFNSSSAQRNISYTQYNITRFASPLFDYCILEIFDNYLKITANKNGSSYNIYALGEDKSGVLGILFGSTREDSRSGIFQKYMQRAFLSKSGYDICTLNTSEDAISEFNDSEQKKSSDSQPHKMSKGELWFCVWEGSARIQKYKADGSYQRRLQNFIRTWNSVAGSGSGTTNWDGLSDAQKAAIHEHDNAR